MRKWFKEGLYVSLIAVLAICTSFIIPKPKEADPLLDAFLQKKYWGSCQVTMSEEDVRNPSYFWAYKHTTQSGDWNDPDTWALGVVPANTDSVFINNGDHVLIPAGLTVNNAGGYIDDDGSLTFDPTGDVSLFTTRNWEVQGFLELAPNDWQNVHTFRFMNINESLIEGGGLTVKVNDIGLWVMEGGRVNLQGAVKAAHTTATGSVSAGATSMTVANASGWHVGDSIIICITEAPDFDGMDWNDVTHRPTDPQHQKFEIRVLTSVSGNTVGWSGGLTYNHNEVVSSTPSSFYGNKAETWKPNVINVTNNVKIGGSSHTSRSHMFIRNTEQTVQNIQFVEFRFTGPRKIDAGVHASRPALISGRYTVHVHFSDYFSAYSLIYGCSSRDGGNRSMVPHESHRITMSFNSVFGHMQEGFWWDHNELSHFTVWEDNIVAGVVWNGITTKVAAYQINMGDGNVARRNISVRGYIGDVAAQGAYAWEANTEGVWVFEFNRSICDVTSIWVWQNTSLNHTIVGHVAFNCVHGVHHGAYINNYNYILGYFYRARIYLEAASNNTTGATFKDIWIDAGGEDYGVEIQESPVANLPNQTDKFIKCVVKNYAIAGFRPFAFGPPTDVNSQYKEIDIIQCDIGDNDGDEYVFDASTMRNGYIVRLQAIDGPSENRKSEAVDQVAVHTTPISDFYYRHFSNGVLGLKGYIYDGVDFNSLKVVRDDATIFFDVWAPDPNILPNGVHNLVDPVNFSYKWRGFVESPVTENVIIKFQGTGKFRVWLTIGGVRTLIIDRWNTTNDPSTFYASSALALVTGTRYALEIDYSNQATGARGVQLHWRLASQSYDHVIPHWALFGPGEGDPRFRQKHRVRTN